MRNRFIRHKARLCKLIVILAVFLVMLNSVYSALSFKYGDGIMGLKYFYQLDEDSVDVLVLGSSHAFENINTGILYDSYGMAAYVLAGSVQPYWSTYYYLREALKTQKPRLVVLDAYGSVFEGEYSDHSRIIKNTLGIRDIAARTEALTVASPGDTLEDYLFDYRLWHSRYTELGKSDFKEYYSRPSWEYYRGFGINFATESFGRPEVDHVDATAQLDEKTEKYYRRIIELIQGEGIPLLIVKSPYVVNETQQMKYNMSEAIAQEYGVEFINFNSSYYYDLMALDYTRDFADASHLNYIGNTKYTHVLAEEIQKRYELPDRRGQSEYSGWVMRSRDILGRIENQYLKGESDISAYFDGLDRERYTVCVVTISQSDRILDEDRMLRWGIEKGTIKDGSIYVIREGEIVYYSADLCWEYSDELDEHTLQLEQSADDKIRHSIMWDGNEKLSDESGCYIVVYDNFSEELVEISSFDWKENAIIKQSF